MSRKFTFIVPLVTQLTFLQATAPRDRSATTVVRSVTFLVIAHPRPHLSVLATSASSQVTSRLSAQTKSSILSAAMTIQRYIETNSHGEKLIMTPGYWKGWQLI